MQYKISSGNGPAECELAVTKLLNYLTNNYKLTIHESSKGYNKDTLRSVLIETEQDLSEYVGSILWICKSPYRAGHKRKNWFINFFKCNSFHDIIFDESKFVFERFHASGNGGQNVNKVETGIRAIYLPTGDSTTCTEERSQLANKKKAILKLKQFIADKNKTSSELNSNHIRINGVQIERGNPVAIFEGIEFKRTM